MLLEVINLLKNMYNGLRVFTIIASRSNIALLNKLTSGNEQMLMIFLKFNKVLCIQKNVKDVFNEY